MIISAHQPAFMPWLGYLHKIAVSEKFVLLDQVQFEKNSFINRNYIMGQNGPFLLTVPIKIKNHLTNTIMDIAIASESNWKKKHLNSIYLNYKKAPFFKNHFSFFEEVYSNEWDTILSLNNTILNYLLKVFEINTEIINMSELQIHGTKTELIINLCKKLEAKQFIFGSKGKEYSDIKLANKENIDFLFQNYSIKKLPYRSDIFEQALSSVDIIFNLNQSSLKEFLISHGKIER